MEDNLINLISKEFNGRYYEGETKSVHISNGTLKSQIVFCEFNFGELVVDLVGMYQYGANIQLVKEDPPYSIRIKIPSNIENEQVRIYKRSGLSRVLSQGISFIFSRKSYDSRFFSTKSIIAKSLMNDKEFNRILSKRSFNVMTTDVGQEWVLKVSIFDQMNNLDEFYDYYDLIKVLVRVLKIYC